MARKGLTLLPKILTQDFLTQDFFISPWNLEPVGFFIGMRDLKQSKHAYLINNEFVKHLT